MPRTGEEMQKPRALPGQTDTVVWHVQVREGEIVLLSCSCPWGTLMAEDGLVKHPGHRSSPRRTGKTRKYVAPVGTSRKRNLMIWEVASMLALFLYPSWV